MKIKSNKYHNTKVIYNGIKFDSKKERDRYIELKQLEKTGIIKELGINNADANRMLLSPACFFLKVLTYIIRQYLLKILYKR